MASRQGIEEGECVMTPEEFAWIRAHVWTDAMRRTWKEFPGFYTRCPCQWGATWWCQNDRHDRCHRRDPQFSPGGYVCDRSGERPGMFARPYRNPSLSASGSLRTSLAMWWYADRVCRWPAGQDGPGLFDVEASVGRL